MDHSSLKLQRELLSAILGGTAGRLLKLKCRRQKDDREQEEPCAEYDASLQDCDWHAA